MFLDGRLDERKRKILRSIIDDYINTAEPIGSRTIARKHELGLSSATIRNEMADLEEMGYLAQPHTSAGRVPSNKGYRLYVDSLMEVRELSAEDAHKIRNAMDTQINELSQLLRQASSIMSAITNYTSMVITPELKKSILKAVQVVPVESGKALIIVVTNAGVVKNSLVKIPDNVSPEFLIKISNILNERLGGLTLEQINLTIIKEIKTQFGIPQETLFPILSGVADCIDQTDNTEVYLDGTTNIFDYPEFRDIVKAKEFLNMLAEKSVLMKLLSAKKNSLDINVQIGTENELDEVKDCSLITATYSVGDKVIGSIGIIGPTRMEYSKVISSMRHIRKMINQEINLFIGENLNNIP